MMSASRISALPIVTRTLQSSFSRGADDKSFVQNNKPRRLDFHTNANTRWDEQEQNLKNERRLQTLNLASRNGREKENGAEAN